MSRIVAVGADVGGTKIALGAAHADGSISLREELPTPRQHPLTVVEAITRYSRQVGAEGVPVGVALAGLVRPDGRVASGSYIEWADTRVGEEIERRLEVPVLVLNDGDAAAWGEYIARDCAPRSLLLVTIGTGLGGGLVGDGKLYRGDGGLALEVGHLIVDVRGPRCECGRRGCLEAVAGGTAIARRYVERIGGGEASIGVREVVEAADTGQAAALEVLNDAGWWLGFGLAQLITVLDTGLIVIGGSVSRAGDHLLARARAAMAEHCFARAVRRLPEIEVAKAPGDAGMLGAALLAANGSCAAIREPDARERDSEHESPMTPTEEIAR